MIQTTGDEAFMYLKITYGWFAEENRGKTADLDKALQDCLDEFGFFQTKARFDMAKGERCLEFETEEYILRDVLSCPHCRRKIHNILKPAGSAKKILARRSCKRNRS